MPAGSAPRQRAHPLVATIVADIKIDEGGVAMVESRFDFWVAKLQSEVPRKGNEVVYEQLCGLALEFARLKAFAALQLFALATLDLSAREVDDLASDQFFVSNEAKQVRERAVGVSREVDGLLKPAAVGAGL